MCRKEYQRPPQWYEREQSWLIAQDAMDVIYLYRQRHEDAGTDYCEAFKAHKHEEDREVERARRLDNAHTICSGMLFRLSFRVSFTVSFPSPCAIFGVMHGNCSFVWPHQLCTPKESLATVVFHDLQQRFTAWLFYYGPALFQLPPPMKGIMHQCRVLRVFWDITVGMYTSGDLPQKFFERGVWLIRATSYMELVEPIEIANYYRCHNWKRWRKGERHYIEGKRPKRFPFFEAQYAIHYTEEKLAPVLDQARREADAVELQELAAVEA